MPLELSNKRSLKLSREKKKHVTGPQLVIAARCFGHECFISRRNLLFGVRGNVHCHVASAGLLILQRFCIPVLGRSISVFLYPGHALCVPHLLFVLLLCPSGVYLAVVILSPVFLHQNEKFE